MAQSLLKAVKHCFTDEVIQELSTTVREEAAGVQQVVTKSIPLVIQHLLLRTERPGGTEVLAHLAQEAYRTEVLQQLHDPREADWQRRGLDLMQGLLGEAYLSTLNRLAVTAYIEPAAARVLLGTVAATVLAVLGSYATEHALTTAQLQAYLQDQHEELLRVLPPTLSVTPASPGRGPTPTPHTTPTPAFATAGFGMRSPNEAEPAPVAHDRAGNPLRWQWGALLLLAVSLGYYFGHERVSAVPGTAAYAASPADAPSTISTAYPVTNNKAATGHYDSETDNYIYETGQPVILQLANGTTQKVGALSTENRLYTFLSEPTIRVDSVNRTKGWINFDRVYFETGQAVLTPESHQQLVNVAGILKSFPNTVVKLGGYTDSLGAPLKNLHLSEERARAALFALADMGIPLDRLQAKGYGAKHYLTSNATVEGRALNRRISIRVLQK